MNKINISAIVLAISLAYSVNAMAKEKCDDKVGDDKNVCEKCDDKVGNDKAVCVKEAKAALARAKSDAKAQSKTSKENETASTTVGSQIDDSVVTTRVKSALLGDPNIKSFDIAVVTRKGVVQLSGFVNNQDQIDRAVAIAHDVPGVHSVTNKMSIKQ